MCKRYTPSWRWKTFPFSRFNTHSEETCQTFWDCTETPKSGFSHVRQTSNYPVKTTLVTYTWRNCLRSNLQQVHQRLAWLASPPPSIPQPFVPFPSRPPCVKSGCVLQRNETRTLRVGQPRSPQNICCLWRGLEFKICANFSFAQNTRWEGSHQDGTCKRPPCSIKHSSKKVQVRVACRTTHRSAITRLDSLSSPHLSARTSSWQRSK